jgi:hypothetical protein
MVSALAHSWMEISPVSPKRGMVGNGVPVYQCLTRERLSIQRDGKGGEVVPDAGAGLFTRGPGELVRT